MKPNPMKHLNQLLLAGCAALLFAGCASAPSKFYTLNATAKNDGAPATPCAVIVGPVLIPATVDRPQFVLTTAPNRVELDEFNRWAAPLNESIARIISLDLGALLGTAHVAVTPVADYGPAYRVSIHIERFESVRAEGKNDGVALVDALWSVRTPAGQPGLYTGHTIASEPVQGSDLDGLAAAHSRAIAKISADIAASIRLAEGEKH